MRRRRRERSPLRENMLPDWGAQERLSRIVAATRPADDSKTYDKVLDSVSSFKLYICEYIKDVKFALTNRPFIFLYSGAKHRHKANRVRNDKLGFASLATIMILANTHINGDRFYNTFMDIICGIQ